MLITAFSSAHGRAHHTAAFGYPAGGRERPAFPKVRVVTIGECGSHAKIAAQMGPAGGKGSCEQALARRMFGRLEQDWLLIADRGFYNWPDWQAATGAAPWSGQRPCQSRVEAEASQVVESRGPAAWPCPWSAQERSSEG